MLSLTRDLSLLKHPVLPRILHRFAGVKDLLAVSFQCPLGEK